MLVKNLWIEDVEKDQESLRNITLTFYWNIYKYIYFFYQCNFFIVYFFVIYLILFSIFYFILNSDLDIK